ncbi:AAA family ATPase [Arsenicicoccus sp. MKL-02]|uniref:AAA family ATPase n=1 Tax=Arsenicicoccus cauae TaxID=2663847 RepID=A0A6I3IVR6_9MICO|nr:AAA family ATPase [Arsenicicoccus cauae]MTB70956.1 AAA family ATPase [Arsenicicoccus cauae]
MPSSTDEHPTGELAREQAYLDRSRTALAAMRERTLAVDVQGSDPIAAEHLARTLWRRARSLEDDPTTALFFGRLDLDGDHHDEQWYVGRRHVTDDAGDPLVIDWRAPASTAFYRASRTDPMGVVLRRRFGLDRGRITALEDEHLTDRAEQQASSQILAREIERPRVGPMRDIVATIQPEQDLLVRVDDSTTVCIQGAPGTGKTAVGLHRAAWLLYAYRDRLTRQGVLVIGPNASFLEHIGAVLPALGEVQVRHTTIEGLVGEGVRVRATDPAGRGTLKGDARLAEVLRRAVRSAVQAPEDALVVPRGARRWRVPGYEVREIVEELLARDVRYDAARQMLPQRLAHAVLVQMEAAGDSPDDRVQDAVARSTPVRRYADALWPRLDPATVLHRLWSDPAALETAADGILSPAEQAELLWDKAPRTLGAARWTLADAVLLDELADLLSRTPSLGHVMLDEAQDLSPMQLRAVGRRCSTGAATVLGDIAQGTTPWATGSWEESLRHLGKPEGQVTELRRGFRVPAAVIEYAARLLPVMAPGLAAPQSVRDNTGDLDIVAVQADSLWSTAAARVVHLARQPGSIGVIVADGSVAAVSQALLGVGVEHGVLGVDHGDVEHQVDVVPATVAKGLEFDRVVVVEPAAIAEAEPDERTGLRRLYVVLTRAVSGLSVIHARPLPDPLAVQVPPADHRVRG